MEYARGRIGRVFAARLADGEPVYEAIEELARREAVGSALVAVVGGARRGTVVAGPKQSSGPIEPILRSFDDAREIVGVGTLHGSDDGPKLHLHAGIGRGDEVIVGCPRCGLDAFLILEVFVLEIEGLEAERRLDPATGLKLLAFAAPEIVELRRREPGES